MTASPITPRQSGPVRRPQANIASLKQAPAPRAFNTYSGASTPERGVDRTDENGVLIIDPAGDIILDVAGEESKEYISFRVDSARLTAQSPYFRALLESPNFAEGFTLQRKQQELRERYSSMADAPASELPHQRILDVGRIGPVKSIKPLMKDFFQLLHGVDLGIRKPPLSNIANLAIVGDRFDTEATIGEWVKKRWPLGKAPTEPHIEEAARQRLLVGLLFDYEPWISIPSFQLVRHGSSQWISGETDRKALWWDLPQGLEEELDFRRSCVLETIASTQAYVLDLYTSRTQQCKLGYDTSPQCDAFQLGELVRFLARAKLLDMSRALGFEGASEPWQGDLHDLMGKLRSSPHYQLDPNHSHCGPKKPLLQCLEIVEAQFVAQKIGICHTCWRAPGNLDLWTKAERPSVWTKSFRETRCAANGSHDHSRQFFMADSRNWNSLVTSNNG